MTKEQNHNHTSPLRYPGGKGALSDFVKLILSYNNLLDGNYVEVYAGGAGIAWTLLFEEYVQRVHINDINIAVFSFWQSLFERTEDLCRLIIDTPVTVTERDRQKLVYSSQQEDSPLELGFSAFYLNRTNRSGVINGGVIGGKNQAGEWKIDARFNKRDLVRRIERIARYRNRVSVYNYDAANFISTILPTLPDKTFVYLDPPYYKKGRDLYDNFYDHISHERIANLVSEIKYHWMISYDICEQIDELYKSFRNIRYNISYSVRERYSGDEVIFFGPNLIIPDISDPVAIKISSQMKPLL